MKSWPDLVINEPYNGFEVPPIRTVAPSVFQPPGAAVLQAVEVSGQVTDEGSPEPSSILSVTVRVDDGPLIVARLTPVTDPEVTTVNFAVSVAVADLQGPHVIAVTATDDKKRYVTQSVTVFVGPPFQIAPASVLIEVNSLLIKRSTGPPYPAQPELDGYASDIQPHLTSLATLLKTYGLTLTGPAITVDPGRQVLRIGLWAGDQDFAAVAAAPGSPLPTLSDVQAAFCFAATPPVLAVAAANYAVAIPTATLTLLATAVSPAVSKALARHNLALGSLTVLPVPPSKVVVTLKGTLPADVPVTVTATATLGTVLLPMPVFPSQKGLEITRISVSSSTGSVLDWLDNSLLTLVLGWLLPFEAIKVSTDAGGDAANYTAIANEVLAALPYEIPFHNTAFSGHLSEDFPVVNVGWTSFGSTDAGIVAGGQLSIADRAQGDVLLAVRAETAISATEGQTAGKVEAQYSFRLQNLDPDSFTWTLSLAGVTQAEGTIAAGSFTQSGGFSVPIRLPLRPGLTITVNGSETCGSDPAMTLTAGWSELITAAPAPAPPTPGKPPRQPP